MLLGRSAIKCVVTQQLSQAHREELEVRGNWQDDCVEGGGVSL